MPDTVTLHVNGHQHTLPAEADTPLLYLLRNDLRLNGPKYGCGIERCGSCMVLVDGEAQPSCLVPASAVEDKKITTLEGIGTTGALHPVQQAILDEQAAQCGYCLNGVIVSAVALLNQNASPSEKEIREALHRVLCRCGSHTRMIRAVQRAAQENQKG